jgi:hypothetical protein
MDSSETDKTPIVGPKPFLAIGPTLHYSHSNVQRCWILAVCAFCISCLFWSKIVTGAFWSFDIESIASPAYWRLSSDLVTGVSIFEYPWQIFVLGLLMGILTITPVLISQLMSFGHSLLFVLAIVLLADLPGFALCVLVSCFGAACRPLRFRSRYIAISLCMAPQVIYWVFFGGVKGAGPIEWGFSFMPWIFAWLDGLIIAAFVLGIGHYTRYRPGLVWIFTLLTLVCAVGAFEIAIGFDELDYQLYVAKNDPAKIEQFRDHSITEALDETITDPDVKKYLGEILFYVTEPAPLRVEMKKEIQIQLAYDRWPNWFIVPEQLNYQAKRRWLFHRYDLFINKRPNSGRMPIALYFKALLSEYKADVKVLDEKEILHFYSDYPHRDALVIWYRLYKYFPESAESVEARWRIAHDWAGSERPKDSNELLGEVEAMKERPKDANELLGDVEVMKDRFEQADKLLGEAEDMIVKRLAKLASEESVEGRLFGLFRSPADSVMTIFKLAELQRRLNQLRLLISAENRTDAAGSLERLARFVRLNPHSLDYAGHLNGLLEQTKDDDLLRDNILLAQAKLVADRQVRAERLNEVHESFQKTDGGMMALYELGQLTNELYRNESDPEKKKKHLADTRTTLSKFLELYPSSFLADQIKDVLGRLPAAETS